MASILERNKKLNIPKKTMQDHAEDALYREVWEDVNNEKTMSFLKKYAKPLIAIAIALLIIVTGWQLWRHQANASRLAAAHTYETAVATMDVNALASIANNTSGATADLALFQSYMLDGNVSKLEKLANDGNTRDFRDLAKIHLASINGDKMSARDFEKYLSSTNTKSSPFYYTGMLMVAQKYLGTGERDTANKWLDKIINDKNAPSVIAANAETLR